MIVTEDIQRESPLTTHSHPWAINRNLDYRTQLIERRERSKLTKREWLWGSLVFLVFTIATTFGPSPENTIPSLRESKEITQEVILDYRLYKQDSTRTDSTKNNIPEDYIPPSEVVAY